MEIRNLKTFLRVAALRNFTAAAKELGYSQANVSAQIKQLEDEVGAPLFDRIGRGVAPT
ncbi:MAG: LysR family transcriptional regulator, partial [Firmicutes bacterium]|nr:LysR family transcriptional regulator [Bacillota bacterium]